MEIQRKVTSHFGEGKQDNMSPGRQNFKRKVNKGAYQSLIAEKMRQQVTGQGVCRETAYHDHDCKLCHLSQASSSPNCNYSLVK